MRILVSAGHGKSRGKRDPGAVNESMGIEEHKVCIGIAAALARTLAHTGHEVVSIAGPTELRSKIKFVNREHKAQGFDLALEIHLNSHSNPQANGVEVLHFSKFTRKLAERTSASMAKALGLKDRGAKKRDNLGFLTKTSPKALIAEVLFVSNPAEAALVLGDGFNEKVAVALAGAITDGGSDEQTIPATTSTGTGSPAFVADVDSVRGEERDLRAGDVLRPHGSAGGDRGGETED